MTAFVVYLFGSGLAFFIGVALVLLGLTASVASSRTCKRASSMAIIVGLVLVALSGTPLPTWFYIAAVTLTGAFVIAIRSRSASWQAWIRPIGGLVVIVWAAGILAELPYQRAPSITMSGSPRLYLFGDSVSAGVGDERSQNWPELLARAHSVEMSNFSVPGATVAVALRQANGAQLEEGIVFLEIGGNDLLGSTTAADFEQSLDQLFNRVCGAEREVLMFELPLPPLSNAYGRIQRRLAAIHQVQLIPKRVFIDVLTTDGATLDSIHLSQRGHERMAEAVWSIIRPAYEQ
jgi:acyl-CoA thioesterase-1